MSTLLDNTPDNIGEEITSDLNFTFPDILNTANSDIRNSYQFCNNNATVNCDDFKECESQSVAGASRAVCCTAANACLNASSIIGYGSNGNNNNSVTPNIAIRCDGSQSCFSPTNGINMVGINGSIYITGYQAGYTTSVHTDSDTAIATNNKDLYDIFCSGDQSCYQSRFNTANNLYCTGNLACYKSPLINNINNVIVYGYQAASYSTMSNINNIYCYPAGKESCTGSTISNVSGMVLAVGDQVLYDSEIYNVSNLFCISTASCKNSKIKGVHNTIIGNGDDALCGTIITSDSNFNDNGTLYVFVSGTNSGTSFDIYCTVGDTCYIQCQSSGACSNLILHCNNNCYVDCDDENGIDCPLSGVYNDWITDAPSAAPSMLPTSPTSLPTAIPTTSPTTPTVSPTSAPTSTIRDMSTTSVNIASTNIKTNTNSITTTMVSTKNTTQATETITRTTGATSHHHSQVKLSTTHAASTKDTSSSTRSHLQHTTMSTTRFNGKNGSSGHGNNSNNDNDVTIAIIVCAAIFGIVAVIVCVYGGLRCYKMKLQQQLVAMGLSSNRSGDSLASQGLITVTNE